MSPVMALSGPSAELAKSPPMTQSEHTSPYPPFLWRDTVSSSAVEGGRMRRREVILGIAMLVNVGRASAQGRAPLVGALIAEPAQANFLDTALREKGWILG